MIPLEEIYKDEYPDMDSICIDYCNHCGGGGYGYGEE